MANSQKMATKNQNRSSFYPAFGRVESHHLSPKATYISFTTTITSWGKELLVFSFEDVT